MTRGELIEAAARRYQEILPGLDYEIALAMARKARPVDPENLTPEQANALLLVFEGRADVRNGRKSKNTITVNLWRRLEAAGLVGKDEALTDLGSHALWNAVGRPLWEKALRGEV